MMACPKCGFQQPQDKFCAKCGVDMQTFRPKGSIKKYLKGFTPLVLVIVGFFLVALLFKRVEKQIVKDLQTEQNTENLNLVKETSTQIGVRAGSLADNSRAQAPAKVTAQAETEEKATSPSVQIIAETTKAKPAEILFTQVRVDYILGEVAVSELEGFDASKSSLSLEQVNPISSFYTEQLNLARGSHSILDNSEDPQEILKLNMRISIEDINAKEVKAKISLRRQIDIAKIADPTNSISSSETIPLNRYLVIPDRLPRRLQNYSGSSILSSLMQSQLFLSQQSELVHILRFYSPQQEAPEAQP